MGLGGLGEGKEVWRWDWEGGEKGRRYMYGGGSERVGRREGGVEMGVRGWGGAHSEGGMERSGIRNGQGWNGNGQYGMGMDRVE